MMVVDVKASSFKERLGKLYDEIIPLDKAEANLNKHIVKEFISDHFIPQMRLIDNVFDKWFKRIYYCGSFYQNLKIFQPNEFDINLVLNIPNSDKFQLRQKSIKGIQIPAGFGAFHAPSKAKQIHDENDIVFLKFCLFDERLGWIIQPNKILNWMESVIAKTINYFNENPLMLKESDSQIEIKKRRNGPALTLSLWKKRITPLWKNIPPDSTFMLDIDLVPVIEHNNTFLVPKLHREVGYV